MRRIALLTWVAAVFVLGACGGEEAPPPATDGPPPTPTMSEEVKTAALEAEMAASLATLGAETAPDTPIGGALNSVYSMIALNLTKAGFSCAGDGPGATCTQTGGSGAFTATMTAPPTASLTPTVGIPTEVPTIAVTQTASPTATDAPTATASATSSPTATVTKARRVLLLPVLGR